MNPTRHDWRSTTNSERPNIKQIGIEVDTYILFIRIDSDGDLKFF